jgi:hypothetical protein
MAAFLFWMVLHGLFLPWVSADRITSGRLCVFRYSVASSEEPGACCSQIQA